MKHKDATPNNDKSETVLFNNSPDTQWVNFSQKPEGTIPPERRKELENWTLDIDFYVDRTDFDKVIEKEVEITDDEIEDELCSRRINGECDALFNIYNGWYQDYLKKNNNIEMNFITAQQYLKDNPNEKPEIKEFIKWCFGICDGDVSNNKQMGLGTCTQLATRDEIGNDTRLKDITENIVRQNEDGTVTVTILGLKIKNENDEYEPMQFTIKNEEIKASYTNLNADNTYLGGSTDPDDAALEIAFTKLVEYINENFRPDEATVESLKKELKELSETSNNIFNEKITNGIISKLYSYIEDNKTKLQEEGNIPHLMELIEYSELNYAPTDVFSNYIQKNPEIYIKEIETLNIGVDLENLQKLINQNAEVRLEIKKYKNKLDKIEKIDTLLEGLQPDDRLTLLTGMGDYVKNYYNCYEIDEYFKSIDYNLSEKCIIACKFDENDGHPEIFPEHAYMVKEIYNDENGKKYITLKNPHNRKYSEDELSNDNIIKGNPGNTFTEEYDSLLKSNNLVITIISDKPIESQKPYYKIPDDFEL